MRQLLLFIVFLCYASALFGWGFWAHKRINHMAVFTLPPEMLGLYKKHIDYLTEHAVDPDKRRYAVEGEEFRHYIDIDHWGDTPFESVPRNWGDVLVAYSDVFVVTPQGDTLHIIESQSLTQGPAEWWVQGIEMNQLFDRDSIEIDYNRFRSMALDLYPPFDTDLQWELPLDSAKILWPWIDWQEQAQEIFVLDAFTPYGILPFHLPRTINRLTAAFRKQDLAQIIRVSADLGHYVGDSHVPLHTTENYNGQLTGQRGIHGFWESRLPELYAKNYDFFVGRAYFIEDVKAEIWQAVYESHMALDSVLSFEAELNQTFPSDQKYSYESRNNVVVRNYSRPYCAAYNQMLGNQVERRMRASIRRLGAIWYTAWKNAGSPDLSDLAEQKLDFRKNEYKKRLKIKDREASGFGMLFYKKSHRNCCKEETALACAMPSLPTPAFHLQTHLPTAPIPAAPQRPESPQHNFHKCWLAYLPGSEQEMKLPPSPRVFD